MVSSCLDNVAKYVFTECPNAERFEMSRNLDQLFDRRNQSTIGFGAKEAKNGQGSRADVEHAQTNDRRQHWFDPQPLHYPSGQIITTSLNVTPELGPNFWKSALWVILCKPALGLQVRTNAAFTLHPCTRKSGCSWWVAIVTDLVSWFNGSLAASSTTGDTTSTVDSWSLGCLQ